MQAKNKDKLLVLKSKVSQEATTGLSVATGSMPNAVGTIPVYDENGTLLGYTALYTNNNLT